MNQVALTPDNLSLVVLVVLMAVFLAVALVTQPILKGVQDSTKRAKRPLSGSTAHRCARVTYAHATLMLSSVLLVSTATLVLGLGSAKVFASWTPFFLPERVFGFSVLFSYACLVTVLRIIGPELDQARKKLFS